MAYLEVYLDESGAHKESPVVVVAGLVASKEQWVEFNREWKQLMGSEGVSALHMADLESPYGKFKDWKQDRKEILLIRLVDLIILHTEPYLAYGCVIKKNEFETIKGQYPEIRISAYQLAGELFAASVHKWASNFPEIEGYSLCFDRGQKLLNQTLPIADEQKIYGTIKKGDKSSMPPLQAADFLAYETYKYVLNLMAGQPRPIRKSFERLLKNEKYFDLDYHPERMQDHFEAILEYRALIAGKNGQAQGPAPTENLRNNAL